jgi:hypothetical protein
LPKSFLGCGTTTAPGRVGCLNTWCDPLIRSSTQPACLSSRIRSVLVMVCIIHTIP